MATPATKEGLEQYDTLDPVVAVIKAWRLPGKHPSWHYRMQKVLQANMPVLARALERLAANCPTCTTGIGRETVNLVCQTCGKDFKNGL